MINKQISNGVYSNSPISRQYIDDVFPHYYTLNIAFNWLDFGRCST